MSADQMSSNKMPEQPTSRSPIAVVGVSALFPGSVDSSGFWSDILDGTDRMTDVPSTHWLIEDHYDADMAAPDRTYGRRGGFLDSVDLDAVEFGIPPNMIPSTDTAQLLALIVAQRVLDDATAGQFHELDRSRASVILGVTSGQELFGAMASRMSRPMWLQGMRRAGIAEDVALAACDQILDLHPEWTEATFPGLLGNVVAGRIANRLNLGGTNCVTDAACASSFSALSMGVNELYLGDSDLVIAGGVDTMNDIFMYMCFSKTPALSKSEDIRPFSDQADGTMLGEGLGMVALKRLEDAERDGNSIYCLINGVGASSDGRSKSVYAPVSAGQARALDNAYAKTSYGPDTVELVEAHGTGTVAGDAAEFGGLQQAFDGDGVQDFQWCALGSVKSQIGHTKAAAGAAGLFKVVMALHHKVLPQTAKIDRPNPKLDLENSPFYLNTRSRPWVRGSDHERRGSVSSFGFGGSNFHVALSEYTGDGVRAPRLRTSDVELVILTGTDGADIISQAEIHSDAATLDGCLTWLAHSSQLAYDATAPARLAIVASDETDLRDKLGKAVERLTKNPFKPFSTPNGIHYGTGEADDDRANEIAFVFPGQGSQHLFMGADLATQSSVAMDAWDIAAGLDWRGNPLHDVVFPIASFADDAEESDAELLTATEWAQPAIGTMSLAMLRVLRSIGVDATHVGGHSFGEVTALHAANVLSAGDMVRVARHRGELMAEAAQTPGSMTAVAAGIDTVQALVDGSGIDVVVANHNSPTQVVLSGPTAAIEQIEEKLAADDLTAKRLPVATAFHSSVVSGASGAFTEYLDEVEFNTPNIPVHANATAAPYPGDDAAAMRTQLGRQLSNSVRFVEMIEAMYDAGARTFVEVGPSSVLTSLIGKILKGRDHKAIALDKRKKRGLAAFFGGIGQLAAAGVAMDLNALWDEYGDFQNPHEAPKPKLAIPINGGNYGSPYPPEDLSELVGPNAASIAAAAPPAEANTNLPTTPLEALMETPNTAASAIPVAPAPGATTPVVAIGAEPSADVMAAYQAVQQQTADAHAAYLNSMAQVHQTFLAAAQQSLTALGQLAGADPTAAVASAPSPAAPVVAAAPAPAVAPAAMAAAPPQPLVVAPVQSVPAAAVPVAGVSSDALVGAVSLDELRVVLLDVVSERTGYPAEMLAMEMELESDLGIDSIKRVEILSAMQDAVPSLPEVDTAVMAELVTLGQIVDYLASQVSASPAGVPAAAVLGAAVPVAGVSSDASVGAVSLDELRVVLLDVVSERTGYPAEMLAMEMELESDLGIDSIKRVEILSAMQDAVPSLPEVDTAVMAELVTLGQIVDYLASQTAGEIASPELPAPAPASNGTAPTPNGIAPDSATPASASNGTVASAETAFADPVTISANGSASAVALGRFTLQASPAVASGNELSGLRGGKIAVTDDGKGIGMALVASLAKQGVDAEVVTVVSPGAYVGVIFLGGLREVADVEDAIAINREAFVAAKAAAPTAVSGGVFVTVTDLGGMFGCEHLDEMRAWTSGVTSLARTAAIEWPSASVKTIDIQRGRRSVAEIAAAIAEELLQGGPELEVGLRADGARHTLTSIPIDVEAGTMPLTSDDVVVVSGGARGVTAATMIELAAASKAQFVLLGRTALETEPDLCASAGDDAALKQVLLDEAKAAGKKLSPAKLGKRVARILANREINATLSAIGQAGGSARYIAVDITDAHAVADAVGAVRSEMGPITGVVHGAGVLADKLIAEKTEGQFDSVFNTKVVGLRALLAATVDDSLKLLCMFSSVAARAGNTGQADYAMANEVLNKVAVAEHSRRGKGCVVKSLGWGPWAGGMVDDSLQAHFKAMGVIVIPIADGARMLVDEIASPQVDQVELVLGGGVTLEAQRSTVVERVDA